MPSSGSTQAARTASATAPAEAHPEPARSTPGRARTARAAERRPATAHPGTDAGSPHGTAPAQCAASAAHSPTALHRQTPPARAHRSTAAPAPPRHPPVQDVGRQRAESLPCPTAKAPATSRANDWPTATATLSADSSSTRRLTAGPLILRSLRLCPFQKQSSQVATQRSRAHQFGAACPNRLQKTSSFARCNPPRPRRACLAPLRSKTGLRGEVSQHNFHLAFGLEQLVQPSVAQQFSLVQKRDSIADRRNFTELM